MGVYLYIKWSKLYVPSSTLQDEILAASINTVVQTHVPLSIIIIHQGLRILESNSAMLVVKFRIFLENLTFSLL